MWAAAKESAAHSRHHVPYWYDADRGEEVWVVVAYVRLFRGSSASGRRSVVAHEFFSHTGEIGVRIQAETVDQLLAEAVVAFTDVLTRPSAVRATDETRVDLDSTELDLLLHDFLSELLYRFEVERRVPACAVCSVTRVGHGWHLDARVIGERFDPARHGVGVLIKGVTYHGLTVRQERQAWTAEIVFDI